MEFISAIKATISGSYLEIHRQSHYDDKRQITVMDDLWSLLQLTPTLIVIISCGFASVVLWLIWRSFHRTTPPPLISRSPSQLLSRENSHSEPDNGSRTQSQNVRPRRKKHWGVLNTVSPLLAGSVRRATVFSRNRLESVRNAFSAPRRQIISRLAKILLPVDTPTKKPITKSPPSRMFDDEHGDYTENLSSEAAGMMRAVRSFCWGVEKPVFQEMCKQIETLSFEKGDMLFLRNSEDDSIYAVMRGQVELLIVDDNKEHVIRTVRAGENLFSMTAIIERLAGRSPLHVDCAARVVAPSQIARLPISAFCSAARSHPDISYATVQTIMIKFSRVVFNALHACLGLSGELVRDFRSANSVQSLSRSLSVSASDQQTRRRASAAKRREGLTKQYSTQDYGTKENPPFISINRSSMDIVNTLGEQKILDAVSADLVQLFGVVDKLFFEGALKVESFDAGSEIHVQDDRNVNIIVVVHGILNAYSQMPGEDQDELFFTAYPGSLLGQLSILSGEPSIYSLRAKTDAVIVSVHRLAINNLLKERPQSSVPLANFVVSELSPFVRHLDHSLGWKQIESGRALYRQNDVADCAYVILHGRIRTVLKKSDDVREVISEHGRDEVIGLVEILTQSRRMFTSMAVRDTEVGSIPAGLVHWLKRTHPKIVTRLIHVIGNRLADVRMRTTSNSVEQPLPMLRNKPPLSNLSTIAVVPASKDVPLSSFTLELQHALNAIGPSLRLTGMLVMNQLGVNAFDSINEYHLQTWLSQQEEAYRMILYQCDSTCTPWSRWCMRQADAVLVVALASADPSVSSPVEEDLERFAVRAQKELVLLYKHDFEGLPHGTASWLATRGWCHGHHHIRCPKRLLSTSSPNRIISTYRRLFDTEANPFSDFSRLARYLTGTSIGLALGGGGARGIAHIGILRAIREAGIPVDMVAGTSIGSFMSALWAREMNIQKMTELASKMADRMLSKSALVADLTYPYAGVFTGRNFNSIIREAICGDVEDVQIEDLWLPYACVTTDVTASKMRIHTSGSLWRYVRASMTLAGYMPPLCDPIDGHLLVDGGYTNNLPADVLKAMGCSVVFTVDVGAVDETDLTNYGDELSGTMVLWRRFWPWADPVKVPNIADIQSRLAYVACCRQLETVKQQPYCVYVRPPIDKYKTLAFNLFDEINKVGYNYGRKFFSIINVRRFFLDLYSGHAIKSQSNASSGVGGVGRSPSAQHHHHHSQQQLQQQQLPKSFTELAELVCRIEPEVDTIDEIEEDAEVSSLAGDVVDGSPLHIIPSSAAFALGSVDGGDDDGLLSVPSNENGYSPGSSACGTLAPNSRANSRRGSFRAGQQTLQQLLKFSDHLDDDLDDDDDDDDDLLDSDTVFDDRKNLSTTRSLMEIDRSLSDTELPKSMGTNSFISNRQVLPLEAESLPITMNSARNHMSLSD